MKAYGIKKYCLVEFTVLKMKLLLVLFFGYLSFDISDARPYQPSSQLIDMTYVFDNTTLKYPSIREYKIEKLIKGPNPYLATNWLQYEEFSSSTHTGTHIDAPARSIKGGLYIDQIPLQAFFGKAAVIDITAKAATCTDAEVTVADLENWESTTQTSLDGHIVLMNSGWGPKWLDRDAFLGTSSDDWKKVHFPGFSGDACKWLAENRNIRGVGVDTASLDVGSSHSFPCHGSILETGVFIIENIANVDKIPIVGARLYVFPMKIGKGSGAPTRVVASIPVTN